MTNLDTVPTSEPSEQLPAPPLPLSGVNQRLYDVTRDDMLDAAVVAEAQKNLADIVTGLQDQITALAHIVADQSEQLARTTAAIKCLDCPNKLQDPNTKDETAVATIAVCMNSGTCTCDLGYALEVMPSTTQPWDDDSSYTEESATAPI